MSIGRKAGIICSRLWLGNADAFFYYYHCHYYYYYFINIIIIDTIHLHGHLKETLAATYTLIFAVINNKKLNKINIFEIMVQQRCCNMTRRCSSATCVTAIVIFTT